MGKFKSRGARREALSIPFSPYATRRKVPEAASGRDRDRDRDQLRGKVEEGLILYLNTGLSEDYMHFNYRPDAAALTLSRRPGIVKFLNYRYSGQGCGALNPKDSLHFELLAMLNTKARFPLEARQIIRKHLHWEMLPWLISIVKNYIQGSSLQHVHFQKLSN